MGLRGENIACGLLGFWRSRSVLFLTLFFLLLAEIFMIVVAPLVVPRTGYLSLYLSAKAKQSFARFLAGEDYFLQFDAVTGWQNRPGIERGKWKLDKWGSRSTKEVPKERGEKQRIVFLGNSVVNGGTEVSAEETISAFVENENIEALNFATMLYAVDQSLLLFREHVSGFAPDVVVVGLSDDPIADLGSRYLPLKYRNEENMPFIKPRFASGGGNGTLRLIPVPSIEEQRELFANEKLLLAILSEDRYGVRFSQFYRFRLLPISAGLSSLWQRGGNLLRLFRGEDLHWQEIFLNILDEFQSAADAEILFLLLPERATAFPSSFKALLPDRYGALLSELQRRSFRVVDGRSLLQQSGYSADELFSPDGVHYTALGNRVIGEGLRGSLEVSLPESGVDG